MKKLIASFLVLFLMLGLFSGCGKKEEKTLNLFTWENVFSPETLEAFTKETGIKINYSNFDSDETMLSKLEAAKGGDYDLVIADDYIIEIAIEKGLVQKLNKEKLSNIDNVNPVFQGQFFDPNNEYTVPYGSGIQTIVYDPTKVEKEITGYADLWDESFKGSIGVTANSRVINGMALKVMNESYNTEDTAVIEKAGEKMLELAPNIHVIKEDSLQDDLISGEVSVAVMYTSQVTMAKLANPDLKVVFPKEGIGFGVMANFVPKNAPNPDAAHAFMDYILRPEVAKTCFEYFGYYCTNKAADSQIDEKYRSFLTLPEDLDKSKMEMIQNISGEALEAHEKAWTAFKSAAG